MHQINAILLKAQNLTFPHTGKEGSDKQVLIFMTFAYLLEGVFLGIAAVLYLCTQGSASAKMNMASTSISLTAIIAVVIGQHLSKLCNPVVGVWIGTVTIKIISSGLLSLGVSTAWQKIINGIFFALLLLVFSVKDILEDQKKRQTRIKALQ